MDLTMRLWLFDSHDDRRDFEIQQAEWDLFPDT
jgi:hypothetical protein